MSKSAVPYDREVLVDVLVHHWPNRNNGCECGWAKLGHSYPGHLADVYEETVTKARHDAGRTDVQWTGEDLV